MVNLPKPNITRKLLGEFIKDPETIRAFETLTTNSDDIASVVTDIQNAPILTLGITAALNNERALTGSGDIMIEDGGPGGAASLDLTDSGVSAGNYGGEAKLVRLSISAKGRVTLAQEFDIETENIVESLTNLFFTNARARAALSGGQGIDYNNATGIISARPAGAYGTPTGTLARATFATYTSPVITNPPTQAEVQAISDHLQILSQTLAALITDMEANGNLS